MGVRRTVAGGVLLAVLAGCAGDGERPPALPPLTATPSPSPSVEAAPTGIAAPTPEGAAEFVRYFYAQVELGYQRKDPNLVARLSAPGCSACARFVSSITRLRANNERVEGLVYDITFAAAPATDGLVARVDIIYNGPEVVRYDATGQVVNREPAAAGAEEQVDLVEAPAGGWLVAEILRT